MTTASVTRGHRPNDDVREDRVRTEDARRGHERAPDALKEAEARRLARMELERATDEGMLHPSQPDASPRPPG